MLGLTLLVIGFAAGALVNLDNSAGDSADMKLLQAEVDALNAAQENAESRLWRLYRERTAFRDQLEALRSDSGTKAALSDVLPAGTYGDGVYIVDEDIPHGEYDGVVVREYGYWARLKATDGTINAIVENGLERGPFVLTIYPADRALELSGVVLTAR